jgi:hypothetical protein
MQPPKAADSPRVFQEEIQKAAFPALDQEIERLVDESLTQAENRRLLERKERHYNRLVSLMYASSKDITELATSYKGFEQSSEAADVVLEEKLKLKSRAAVAFVKQRQRDRLHTQVVAAMMQIAMAHGLKDPLELANAEKEGMDQLTSLVGSEQAAKTEQLMAEWCERCQTDVSVDNKPIDGPLKLKAVSDKIMHSAMNNDAVVGEIRGKLHKYNGRSNLARVTAKAVNIGLSVAAFSPTFISPAAQVAWCAYIVTQGGPEEAKLLKEVYLAKRFESRFNNLTDETNLALNGYNTGVYTHNPQLLAFSQFVIGRICEPTIKADARSKGHGKHVASKSEAKPDAVDASASTDVAKPDQSGALPDAAKL